MNRIFVTGSRNWRCDAFAARIVARLKARYGSDLVVVHGAAPGVDTAFDHACLHLGVTRDPHPASWRDLGSRAGPLRNADMIELRPAFVVALHRDLAASKGTKDCVRQAIAAGIRVWLIESEDGDHAPRRLTSV